MGIAVSNIMRKQNYASACTYLYEYESNYIQNHIQDEDGQIISKRKSTNFCLEFF